MKQKGKEKKNTTKTMLNWHFVVETTKKEKEKTTNPIAANGSTNNKNNQKERTR